MTPPMNDKATKPDPFCTMCDGRGDVSTTDYVDGHAFPSGMTCPQCSGLGTCVPANIYYIRYTDLNKNLKAKLSLADLREIWKIMVVPAINEALAASLASAEGGSK